MDGKRGLMDVPRTFVVRIGPERGGTLLENVRTRERVRLSDLSEVPERIAGWLEPAEATGEATQGDGDDPQDT